jgi:hypothetical protein
MILRLVVTEARVGSCCRKPRLEARIKKVSETGCPCVSDCSRLRFERSYYPPPLRLIDFKPKDYHTKLVLHKTGDKVIKKDDSFQWAARRCVIYLVVGGGGCGSKHDWETIEQEAVKRFPSVVCTGDKLCLEDPWSRCWVFCYSV